MQRRMRATLSGWRGNIQVAIEVSASVLDRFNKAKKRHGYRESELMSRIVSQIPHNHHLDEKHVIWYLDMLDQQEAARKGSEADTKKTA